MGHAASQGLPQAESAMWRLGKFKILGGLRAPEKGLIFFLIVAHKVCGVQLTVVGAN